MTRSDVILLQMMSNARQNIHLAAAQWAGISREIRATSELLEEGKGKDMSPLRKLLELVNKEGTQTIIEEVPASTIDLDLDSKDPAMHVMKFCQTRPLPPFRDVGNPRND